MEHAVDRRAPAQDSAARHPQWPPAEPGLRLAHESPGEARIEHRLQESQRHPHEQMIVLTTGFEQQHGTADILRKPAGNDASCGARADDDVVHALRAG